MLKYAAKLANLIFCNIWTGADELDIINDAMYRVQQAVPCIRFGIWPQDSEPYGDYVHIFKGNNGCWSYVGRQGGRQEMSMAEPWCTLSVDNFMHEIIHGKYLNGKGY